MSAILGSGTWGSLTGTGLPSASSYTAGSNPFTPLATFTGSRSVLSPLKMLNLVKTAVFGLESCSGLLYTDKLIDY